MICISCIQINHKFSSFLDKCNRWKTPFLLEYIHNLDQFYSLYNHLWELNYYHHTLLIQLIEFHLRKLPYISTQLLHTQYDRRNKPLKCNLCKEDHMRISIIHIHHKELHFHHHILLPKRLWNPHNQIYISYRIDLNIFHSFHYRFGIFNNYGSQQSVLG